MAAYKELAHCVDVNVLWGDYWKGIYICVIEVLSFFGQVETIKLVDPSCYKVNSILKLTIHEAAKKRMNYFLETFLKQNTFLMML